jgi:general secretion pathway protein G
VLSRSTVEEALLTSHPQCADGPIVGNDVLRTPQRRIGNPHRRTREDGMRARDRLRHRRTTQRSHSGFTLLELLVVVVIIGLLAGLVAPRYFNQVEKSHTRIAKAQIDSLEKALDQYRLDVGSYPTTEQGLQALFIKPGNLERWQGPYLKKAVPPDPWGRPYRYKSPGDHSDYDLYSLGNDGQPGGSGEAADVNSWSVPVAGAAQ